MPNICFEYLYRDASNYKNWGEVIFPAEHDLDLVELESKLREALLDKTFFDAEKAGLPTLYFDNWHESQDVTWHEFSELSTTTQPATTGGSVDALIARLNRNNTFVKKDR